MSFTIITAKEQSVAPRPLFLCQITAVDGNACYLSSAADTGVTHTTYAGHDYLCRVQNQAIEAIQAFSPQGYDIPPAFNLTIADGDFFIWTNHCTPHGWRGATLTVSFVMYDVIAQDYSTDALQWQFILGNPKISAKGIITVDSSTLQNLQRQKVPSVPRQIRCPWVFPVPGPLDLTGSTARTAALNDSTSVFYQCGYSPDVGGVGNLNSGVPFLSCDFTRQNCEARGMFSVDSSARPTGRNGGDGWQAPVTHSGKKYTTGEKVFGFNIPNNASNEFYNLVYGKQWVDCTVLEPAGEPNSLRGEAIVCVALDGAIGDVNPDDGIRRIEKVLVNGVEVPISNDTSDLVYRYYLLSAGGRNGKICTDDIFDSKGDPHGSLAKIEWVVPVELAATGSVPRVQALVNGPPIAQFNSSGVITGYFQTTNPVWQLIDLLTWGNWQYSQMDLASAYKVAAYCDTQISYKNLAGATVTHERFRSSFVLAGTQRQTLAQAVTALRNNAGIMLGRNSSNGLLTFGIRQTMAEQQSAPVAGSNYNTAIPSHLAADNPLLPPTSFGYVAYLFSGAGSIEKDTLQIDTRAIADTPNRVTFPFQDRDNAYQLDSISVIDPDAYTSSGNMEVDLPLQILGIDSFDQGIRRSNAELSQALRGNPRDDAGGTLYLNFTSTVKAIHLLSTPGAICGIDYEQLGL